MGDSLKYAMALPLQPELEGKILELIRFADDNLPFFVEKWKKGAISRARKNFFGFFRRYKTDEEVLKNIEQDLCFFGYDWVKEYRCPIEVRPSTRDALLSLYTTSRYFRVEGQTGFAYNSQFIADYIASPLPDMDTWKAENETN